MAFDKTDHTLDDADWSLLFDGARSFSGWTEEPVAPDLLHRIHELVYLGPTSFNCEPLRVVFLTTPEAKERLRPGLMAMNVEKSLSAPVVAIMAIDQNFFEYLDNNLSHNPVSGMMRDNPALASETAVRNANLQAGYFILVARGLGLDCAPMSGILKDQVDTIFFSGSSWKTNFICALGHGQRDNLFPRLPRLPFATACKIL